MAAGERIKGLKIVLGADATELIKSINDINRETAKTMSNLRDVNKALKFDPGNVKLLTDKQQALTRAIDESKEKLQKEQEALDAMKANGVSETSREFQDLKTQIDIDESALKSLQSETKK